LPVLSSTRVFEGRVFDVVVEEVAMPHGGTARVDIVRHAPSVVLIPVPAPGQVVLLRQYRHAIARRVLELPAGTIDPGEDLETAAQRELHEEIGRRARRITPLGEYYPTPGFCDELMTFFLMEDLYVPAEHAEQDPDEILEPEVFTIDEVRRMIRRGEVVDMKTIAGLALIE
ncbi:MAG: NUDIX hydrolase, partial [Vicinamibacteraceae bacterium]|nr:NUDIX hydrolase [Vicinamibacteraceae bacterium]